MEVPDLQVLVGIAIAFGLCAVIGLERQLRHKAAGFRTHVLVGIGSALFMVVSKWAFMDVVGPDINLDPSRVAAQIVSGIGFIGGGLIFVRRDIVRGLTTAATIWLAAAIGAAAGGGLWLIATVVTAAYLVVTVAAPPVLALVPGGRFATVMLRVSYADGRGLLRDIVQACTTRGLSVVDLDLGRQTSDGERVDVVLELEGPRRVDELVTTLAGIDGVFAVGRTDDPAG